MVVDANGDGQPNYGDTVTFIVSTTVTDRPYVALECFQGGVEVYSAWAGFYPDFSWTQDFTLKSQAWTGGAGGLHRHPVLLGRQDLVDHHVAGPQGERVENRRSAVASASASASAREAPAFAGASLLALNAYSLFLNTS
jgi:hypothetical protein